MQHIISVLGAVAALSTPQTSIATHAPVAVAACSVSDLVGSSVDLGFPVSYTSLALTFQNTQDVDATQVTFDVVHGGDHKLVTDRGRFSKGVAIEHFYDDFMGTYSGGATSCTLASVTFADGTGWSMPRVDATAKTAMR